MIFSPEEIRQILSSPELAEFVEQRAEMKFISMSLDQRLTRDQMAKLYQVHRDSVDNLTEDELRELGWRKIYVKSLPRFERIGIITNPGRENFRRVKKSMR